MRPGAGPPTLCPVVADGLRCWGQVRQREEGRVVLAVAHGRAGEAGLYRCRVASAGGSVGRR